MTSHNRDIVPLVVKGGSRIVASMAAKPRPRIGRNSLTSWEELGPSDYGSKPWYLVNPKIAGIYGCSSH